MSARYRYACYLGEGAPPKDGKIGGTTKREAVALARVERGRGRSPSIWRRPVFHHSDHIPWQWELVRF